MLNISTDKVPDLKEYDSLYSMKLMGTPRTGKIVARWTVAIFIVFFLVMFLPWQQNIMADGAVTAFAPADRPQTVETAIAGRIEKWHVMEGDFVKKGDRIVTLSEVKDKYFDPEIMTRIKEQLEAKQDAVEAYKAKIAALEAQIAALYKIREFSTRKAENKLLQTSYKVIADSAAVVSQQADYKTAVTQLERAEVMYKQGLISLTELEKRRLKVQETQAKLSATENKFYTSKNEYINAMVELSGVRAEYADKISKAESEKSSAVVSLKDGEGEFSKMKNEYANLRVRQNQYYLQAPQDGYIVHALKAGLGETVKEGEAIVTIMPHGSKVAVELFVQARDVTLLSKGRKVRMEFEGFPALQFSGWPSVSVGTFGGIVEVIDYVANENAKYRILVVPDQNDEAWPKLLRLGSRVHGWAMLDEVPIWYEIWRQLNSFPPTLKEKPKDFIYDDELKKLLEKYDDKRKKEGGK